MKYNECKFKTMNLVLIILTIYISSLGVQANKHGMSPALVDMLRTGISKIYFGYRHAKSFTDITLKKVINSDHLDLSRLKIGHLIDGEFLKAELGRMKIDLEKPSNPKDYPPDSPEYHGLVLNQNKSAPDFWETHGHLA